ncbi:DUF2920 family protein [Campylobacter hyointestinalis]|uniref:DUF2920 family protein n=2 Tax=Campylobacter TaxID=194 RepID=A0AAV6EEE6_CAMHY|nr:DUF2920 family protein [Campylobacter hyointestinalis]KAB0612891.1 DUF2920 family protein [Campylobacter hyointestinalis subsp. lawsonii]QKF69492.1 DUF2920 domain-containing protein [Campylobacter hyointestinalis subsp. lawsonii]RAZ29112.1 hypothetical protein CHLT_02485 [Campylobacter hyointestinalis subsp. lawsonii]
MTLTREFEIDSCDDVELAIKRRSKLKFKVTFDDELEQKAIVVLVPGCGDDNNSSYQQNLAEFTSKFGVIVLQVRYFGIRNRTHLGGTLFADEIDKFILKKMAEAIGLDLNFQNDYVFRIINEKIENLKKLGKLPNDYKMSLSLTIAQPDNEYQNFGVMSAIDVINALIFTRHNLTKILAGGGGLKNLPCILIGSSHGGYIAYMCAKIAPWLIDAVIENSSYTKTNLLYSGFGKQIDFTKYYSFKSDDELIPNLEILISDITLWSLDEKSPYFFSKARECIRDIDNLDHLKIQKKFNKTKFISYHSTKDNIAPFESKAILYQKLNFLGFKNKLNVISHQSQIDGKFIKNLEHGMSMSLKILLQKELVSLLEYFSKNSINNSRKKEVVYPSNESFYKFKETKNGLEFEVINS